VEGFIMAFLKEKEINLKLFKKLVFILILFALSLIFMPKVYAYTVTYPDNKVDTVEAGEKYILSMKDHKEPETISTVTFKSHQNGVDDYVSHVKKKYFLEKWIIDGVEYEPGSPIEVNSDITVTGSYHEYIEPVTIPSAPIVRGYTFIGWYDQEEGGTRYKTYSGTQDLTLHAQYETDNKAYFTVEVTDSKWTKFKSTATAFRKATNEEYNAKQAELTSSNNYGSDYYPLYIWLEGTELVYYTEFSTINTFRTSRMFSNWSKIEYIDLSGWYINSATDLSYMFYNCSSLTYLDISDFDTSKVTDMSYMFSGTKLASLDLSHFNTSKVTEMMKMFSSMGSLEYLNISSFDTSKVTNMGYLFSDSNINYLDLSNFNTSNVTNMNSMFYNSKNTNYLNISSFDTSKVTYMSSMFSGSSFKHLDLSNLDVSQLKSFDSMFYNAQSLEYVDLSNWDTRRSTSFYRMFKNCYNLKYLDLSSFKIYKATNLTQMFQGCRNLEELDLSSFDLNNVEYISYMFAEMSKIKTIDISNFSTPNLKNMQCLFCDDTSLETIYANELFNTDQCPTGVMSDGTMVYVFVRNDNLVGQAGTRFSEVSGTGKEYAVIDDPDNGKPGYFTYKAYNPKIYYPDMSYEEVEPYYVLTLPESYSKADDNLAKVTLKYEDGKTEDKEVYVKKNYTFNNWLVYDEVAEPGDTFVITFDTYLEADYVEAIAGADLSPARRSGYKFLGWYTDPENGELVESYNGEEDITLYAHWGDAQVAYLIDGSTINGKFDRTNTTEFRRATLEEYNAANLTSDSIISTNDSPNVVYMWNTTIDSKVVTLYYTEADFMYMNADSSHMFQGLKNITELDLSDFITSNVTDMSYMFGYIGVTSLDLSTFDTSNVTKMNEMFFNSANLQELNVSSFDVSNVTTMVGMFNNCPSMQELDISSFDTRNVRLMGSMFAYCSKLTTIYASDKWTTSGLNYNANQSTMFIGDGRIMGYLGSKYDYYWHGDEKARIDGGPGNEGYFTDISHKGETHTVTFPDNSVRTYNHNSIVYLDTNETSLGEHTSGEITFKYNNGNIDTTSNQVFEMAGDGFTCDNTHYRDNGEVRVNADKVIEYAYKPVITNSVFPEDPVKDGYIFMGWFTEEEGGEKYTEYTGDEPIVLHAQYGLPISYLMSGSDINDKINYFTDYSSINEFRRGTIEEYNQAKDYFNDDYNIISTDESPLPTYMWYDGENILYYSDAENIYMNADSSNMFSSTYASSIDVTEFDTRNVTNMSYMFSGGEMTELDLSHFITSNVTNMTGMFDGCSSLQTIYVSNKWSTESLEDGNGQYMFNYDENLVGSSGTTYDEDHIDEEYARPDEGVSNPGYFTLVTLYNVTYPNSSTRSYKDGTVINLGENDSPAIIETAGTITFKYHDDETEDTTLTKITTKTPNGFIVNGNHIDDNEDITINEDKVIEYDYDEEITGNELPEPTREGHTFLGWYTEEEGGEKVEEYNSTEDLILHAHWNTSGVKLTVDGDTQYVEPGYIYTVPNATPDPYAPVNNKIHIHLYYMDEEDTQKDVTISEGYSIGYQIINGDTYYPGDTYVVNDETEVVSIYDWNGQYAMDPYIKEPTRDGYIFMGWQLYNWEYYDVSDINVDIYTIEPYYTWFDGASFYAEWQEEPDPDEYVVVRYKDYIKKQDYKKIYPKGYVYTFKDLTEVNPFDVEIRNNVNDDTATVTYTTNITSNSYAVKIVGSDDESWRNSNNWYHPGDTYEINEDIEIEVLTAANTNNSYYNGGCSGDAYLCELVYATADNSRYNNYIFRGVYAEENGQGVKIDPHTITNNNTYYGSHNGFNTLWVYLEEVDENSVIVTVDGEVFIMPKGEGTIPTPSITSETMNYIITYKFNNGDPDVLGIDTVRYYIDSLDYNGDEYQLGDTFDFEEDTTFWSNWQFEPIGDGLLEVNDEHFLGWFDENDNQVTSLDDIEDNITLYAHWDYPDVNVTLEGETNTVPYGFTYDLAEFKNLQSTVDAGTITFHDESGNYEGEVWTTSAQRTPSKAYINDVEYELDGEYTFIEDTVIEFEYEFEFTDEELPRDKSIMGREHYTFGGWYDNPDYEGDPITKYSGTNNIDVYAKWIGEEVIVILNEDEVNPLIYHYGDTYTFGDLPESFVWDMGNEIFDFDDGVTPNSTQHLIMTIYPDTWFYHGHDENGDYVDNTYNAGDTVTLYGETWIDVGSEDDNNYVYSGVTIPDDPEREHYTFDGWYNEWDTEITDISGLNGFDEVITAKWIGEDVTVHLPDEDITVEYGREYPTYENNYPKANTEEATVTFKYHDGETDDYVSYVEKSYTPNGWLINDTHYGEDTIVFTEETTLVPDYAETVIPVEFPSDPTWFRHDFDGWFTEETGGEQVTNYSDLVDTELHAHWHDHMAIITTPDGDVQVDENKQFAFPTNNIPKDSTKPGIVTFDPQNGEVPIKNDIIKIYTPNGWLLDGVHYDDGETITVLDDSTITPDYTETVSVQFPSNPVKTYYTFKGWYSAMAGGDKVENYNEAESITLYAHYYQTNPDGEEYILPSEHPERPTETLATVTFDPHNGDPITTSTVTKKWIAKGWLVDGELHYNGDIIYKTPDTVIEPNYTYVIVPAQFPIAPTRGNERYTGWFTEEIGGEQVKRYSGTENITLHAQYTDSYAILKTGREVNNIMENRRPNSFKPATYEEYQTATTTTIISTDDSPYPVYFWVSSTGAHYYSDADVIYFNEDSNYFFAFNYYNLCDIDLSKMNSSYVTDFGYFFWGACSTGRGTLPLNQLDTSNGINFSYMFDGTGMSSFDFSNFNTSRATNMNVFLSNNDNLTSLDLTPLDTSHVTDMHYMFSGNDKMTSYDLSNWDTSSVTDMSMMFSYNNSLVSLDLSSFDTRNATSIGALVSECPKLESINLSSFNTSNVTNMYAMFKNDKSLKELDLSSFDTSKVTTTQEMFRDATSLEKIWVSDKWDMSSVTTGNSAFLNDTNIIGQRGTTYEPLRRHGDNSTNSGAFIDEAPDRPGYLWNKYATKYTITLPDGIEEVYEGAPFVVPTNTYPKNLEIEYTITFDPMNGEEVITSSKMMTYEPVGFTDGENVYESGSTIYVTGDMTLTPYYNEVVVEPDFPEDPVKDGNEFTGWFTEGGDEVTSLDNIDTDTTLYAHYEATYGRVLESIVYTVTDKTNDRIVIGAEPNTTLIDFKDNMINPNEFIKIYDLDNNELLDDDIVKTGLIIKLEINGTVYDEAIMIVRGDIDGDGIISVSDEAMLTDHILSISVIDDYRFYAADIEEDELLDVVDDSLITDYILGIIDSLNE
jgi:uncharacterized repeat protein (TIGR02543 family)